MKQKFTFLLILLFSFSVAAYAQNHRISGVVISAEDNSPIPGATLVVEGTTTGTNADRNGQFNLSVPNNGTVVVEFLGMKPQRFTVTEPMSNMRVVLESEISEIDEVIVIAYGTTTRASFTGSASVVGADKLEARAISNLTSGFEGNASGVQVTASGGQPGESASLRIRGFGSYGASSAPLYVVDGAVYSGDLSSINPSDIASMTILKDAQSTALYGSSAGNGVVLITTKKGSSQKGSITFNVSQGISERAYKDYKSVDAWDYYPLQWTMLKNAYVTAGKSEADAANLATFGQGTNNNIFQTLKYNPFTGVGNTEIVGVDGKLNPNATSLKWGDDMDWEDAAYGTGHRQEYNMSYNSRTDNSDTYASVGYLNEKGYMINTGFERYTGRINYNMTPLKWLKTGLNLGMTRSVNKNSMSSASGNSNSSGNMTRFIRNMAPIYPIHKHDLTTGDYIDELGNPTTDPDKYVYDYDGARLSGNGRHVIAEQLWNERKSQINTNMAKVYLTIMPIDGLELTVNYSVDTREQRANFYRNKLVGDGAAYGGYLQKQAYRNTFETLNQLVNYRNSWGKHNVSATLGHENQQYRYEQLYGTKGSETVGGIYEFPNFVDVISLTSSNDLYTKEAYFGRVNYDYDSKYYFSATYRRDGTSRFSKDNRWGDFWSFGGSWRISQEDFMKTVTWVDNLKIRASYGETGVDAVIDSDNEQMYYPYQSLYNLGVNNASESGFFFNTLANSNLKWETQVSTDVALEFSLFGKLSGTVEYFQKDSKDLIFDVSIAASNGVKSMAQNVGKMRNSGIEVELNYNILSNRGWRADFGFNITFLKNKMVRLPADNRAEGIVDGTKKLFEGKSLYEFWLRQWWGVNPDNGDGLYYLDTDKYYEGSDSYTATVKKSVVEITDDQGNVTDYLTNSYTYAKYDFSGHANPNMYGGFNFHVGYKAFDLTATFSYQLGGKMNDVMYAGMMSMSSYGESMHPDIKNAWKAPGDITDVPRLDGTSVHATSAGASGSTRFLVSSDYLNLRSIALSYNLPKALLQKMQISNARLTLNAENLFMLKKRQGLFPAANFSGVTYNLYTPSRSFTVALNVTF